MLRIIHTADWHLGQTLRDYPRDYEHQQFLDWLHGELVTRQADALLVAGDVFDTSNPTSAAQKQFYGFLAGVTRALPKLQIVIIAGNHDSPARLEAPRPVLDAINVRVVGGIDRRADGTIDTEALVFPLTDAAGATAAWCAAIPFLRPCDLEKGADEESPLIGGARATVAAIVGAARARRQPGQALVALSHSYMRDGQISDWSERKIIGGGEHALPVDIFADDLDYVALGHLHLAQTIGKRANVRYSGSPLPLALDENSYPHQVVQIEIDRADGSATPTTTCTTVRIPRSVRIIRVPETGAASLDAIVEALAKLPPIGDEPIDTLPFVDVCIDSGEAQALVRQRLDDVLRDRAARLARFAHLEKKPRDGAGADSAEQALPNLQEMQADDVFRMCYTQRHHAEVPADILALFNELQATLNQEVKP